jgi:pimeloyl-ACP methyl ester carboxylesterase
MWPQFRAMADIPTLVLRGENSDLLSAKTVEDMRRAKPDLTAVTVKGRGHVPFLDEPEAMAAITGFLTRIDAKAEAA